MKKKRTRITTVTLIFAAIAGGREAVKRLVALTMLFLLVMLVGCGSQPEKEAVKRAKEYWKLTQIGGSTYLCAITTETSPSGFMAAGTRASKTVYELRNIKVKVGFGPPSEVEKLNGVEYDGIVNLVAAACRRYSPQPHFGGQPDKTWSDWSSASGITSKNTGGCVDALRVRKIHGEWKVEQWHGRGNDLYYVPANATFKQVEASDLPK
jgi:hypothetical protein